MCVVIVVTTILKPPFPLQSVFPSCQAISCVPIRGKSLFLCRECKRSQDLLPFLAATRWCPAPVLHFFHQRKEVSVWVCQAESGEEHSRGSWETFPSFLFRNLEAGGPKQKMLAYTWMIRSLGCCVVFWMIDTFLMLEVLQCLSFGWFDF